MWGKKYMIKSIYTSQTCFFLCCTRPTQTHSKLRVCAEFGQHFVIADQIMPADTCRIVLDEKTARHVHKNIHSLKQTVCICLAGLFFCVHMDVSSSLPALFHQITRDVLSVS